MTSFAGAPTPTTTPTTTPTGPGSTTGTGPAAGPTVMERLRDSTAENHKNAEGHALQSQLAKGTLSKAHFVAYHAQLYLVHAALESQLSAKAAATLAISRVVKIYQLSAQYLAADLRHFGVDPAGVKPTPATTALTTTINTLASTDPIALLGMHYVLEGSKNGAKYLCRVVNKAYGLTPGQGALYMDAYGEQQRAYWQAFKDDMNAVGFSEEQTRAMIGAAMSMFDAIAAIGSDVLAG